MLDAVMEEGKSNGIPTDYLREESANCRTSKDGNVCGDFRDLKGCADVCLDFPGRFFRVGR